MIKKIKNSYFLTFKKRNILRIGIYFDTYMKIV